MNKDIIEKPAIEAGLTIHSYAALSTGAEELSQVLRDNLGGERLQVSDFQRVKVPAGGATSWEIETLEGPQTLQELTGIILHTNTQRAYWEGEFTGEGTQPDCFSEDAVTGRGEPGGDCDSCAFAAWESDSKGGRGQACKLTRRVFLLTESSILPILVIVPPGSLKVFKQFMLGLTMRSIPYYGVEVALGLDREKNANGISYSRIKARVTKRLEKDEAMKVKQFADQIRPIISKTSVIDIAAETHMASTG